MTDPMFVPQWRWRYAFCGQCWEQKMVWVKGNVGYCEECRPDWSPTTHNDGPGSEKSRQIGADDA